MKRKLHLTLLLLLAFVAQVAFAQAPVAPPEEAVTALLNRIGGNGAADKFEIVIDANLAENGKDVFVITSQNGKPCIKGNTQLSVATGINWYLNHHAHINLTWNNLTTDLSQVTLPVPAGEETHVSSAKYRYNFNTCTFSYSMAFWTWERWQQEIDWMALHGINAPLNLVGLEVVTRKFLEELGVSEEIIDNYIAGPGFMAWFAMNNLEGWGSTINATDITMNGNPNWWYTRQEKLCRNMMQRMRELGMQPVIPGFNGQIPRALGSNTTITGFNKSDIVEVGSWGGGFTHPSVVNPSKDTYKNLATIYYKHLHDVMGISEFYSIDPFHEMSAPLGPNELYPGIMVHLDRCYALEGDEERAKFNAPAQPKWIIQQWQGTPVSGAFSAMSSYGDRFIGLDLFADAPGKAQWNGNYYQGRPYIFCMLHNFGGRSGMHGRLESTMNDYFRALAKGNNCQGIGATPEGSETNPILYDMLFELPWMDPNNRPTADEWLAQYAHARYGVDNVTAPKALEALKNLKKSVWACPTDQQGTSEAVILARPKWTVNSVSSWSTSAIYWDTQDVLQAADELSAIKDVVTANGGQDGIANYNYDFIDVVRQAMVDYAAELLPLIKAAHDKGDNTEYTRLYQLYLQLMLDLDTMLSYDEGYKLERWTSLARNIADEVDGTTKNDRNWLEWNARTQITVWAGRQDQLNDYSNRCWAGLIKDYHYERWKYFFENNGNAPGGNWYSGFERPWTVNFTDYDYSKVVIPGDMTATEKAAETFGKYFGRVKGVDKNYLFPMGVKRNATKTDVVAEVNRGQVVMLPLEVGKVVTISSVWIDLNNDGAASNNEKLEVVDGNKVTIPADAAIGKTTAQVVYSDGTDITFSLALVEDITIARTVTAVAGANGSVAIEGTNELSITNTEAVKMTATANTGYNFKDWTDANGNVVSNDNPFIYYGKEEATFTANFIQDKWGVVACNGTFSGDIVSYNQFIHNLTFAYYNREAETIFETTTAPTEIFNTIPQIVNVPQGASFDISYDNGNSDGLKYCYFRAFIDFNADGDFDDEGELLKEVGTNGAANTAVCSNKINVLLPYDMPLGITHMRLRFDGAWDNSNKPSGRGAKDASIRPVYELIINVTEFSEKAAHITVDSNNEEWGTVKVWTNETPADITATEWNVTKGVLFSIAAEKTSEDVEFLGWYDHYGRLLTTELEYTMYAREDATYTAKFRKALDIDGWQFEYRTEPGSEMKIKGNLSNGVKPENGKKYYIYAPTNYNSVSATRYLYDNNGTLATNTTADFGNYVWTCIVNEDNTYSFQNASGKYLANNNNYYISIGTTAAKYKLEDPTREGVSLVNSADYTGGKYMVTKHDGSAYNRNSTKTNGEWCSDYVFVEISTSDVVILTDVRQSGNHDLVIPETVEILGEQCKIVGFDNGVFNNNKDLWSITMPKSMEFLSEKALFSGTMVGTITPGAGRENAEDYTVLKLDQAISVSDGFKVTVKGTTNGNTFNKWGSGLFATGENPLLPAYQGGFQFYLASDGSFIIKVNNSTDSEKTTIENCKVVANKEFTATILYNSNNIQITIDNGNGDVGTYSKNCTLNNISAFSAAIPTGITLNVNVETNKEANPFSGCSNLDNIAIDGDCANYYVNDGNGDLYNSSNVLVCSPEGKAKGAASRELAALIEKMKSLTAQVATYDPIGKTTEIVMQSTGNAEPYYIWCNNPHTSGNDGKGGVAALLDEDPNSYLHTNWSSVSSTYDYLQIDNVNPEDLKNFKIAGQQRADGSDDRPKIIEIYGSNDKTNWTPITTVTGLPDTGGATWTSDIIPSNAKYSSLKFVVKTHDNENNVGRPYFHMAKFDLFKLTSSATLHKHFVGTALTADFAAEKYDVLLDAIYAFEHESTVDGIQNALTALQDAYTDLENTIKDVTSVKFTLDENNPVLHKIIIKRADDGSKVLHYDETSKMVAVAGKADNSSWQAWYFIGDANGITIHPYNADGRVLGATNTSNGAGKVSAVDEATYDRWTFLKQSDGYFNLQASNGAYFSNFGGDTNKMGFWDGDNNENKTQNDGGSLFKIEEVDFANDNPRFYQLSDVRAALTDGADIPSGTNVGLYSNVEAYRTACATASALISAGNTSSSEYCNDAYTALRNTKAEITYNEPDENKFYVIKSVAGNEYCKDKYVHTYCESHVHHHSTWGDKTYDHQHLLFDAPEDISQVDLRIFQLEKTENQGEYNIKNLHTGLYVKSFGKDSVHMGDATSAAKVKIAGYSDGAVTLKIGNNDPMHAQQDYGVIVTYGAAEGNASLWSVEEIAESEICYKASISPVGYSTLYLNYPVAIPSGLSAYTTTQIGETTMRLTEISGVIPARTAVILQGKEGTYDFCYSETEEQTNPNALLKGTLYKETITKDNGFNYYVLANVDKKVGFYQAVNGNDTNTFINAANKAYLQVSPSEHGISLAFLGFDFDDDQETGIAETENGNVDGENAVIIDLQGRRLQKANKSGIYIVNGKKVLVK